MNYGRGFRRIVRIDADPTQLHRTVVATVGIAADAKLALAKLQERIGKHNRASCC